MDESGEEERPKKKGKKKKAAIKIQSEETLEMLMNALKPQNTKGKKKREVGEEVKEEEENDTTEASEAKPKKAASKKKKTLGSTQTSFKKPQDTLARFFNSYGDTPHL